MCPEPPDAASLNAYTSGTYAYLDVVTYHCNDGFRLENGVGDPSSSISCKADQTWDKTPGMCDREYDHADEIVPIRRSLPNRNFWPFFNNNRYSKTKFTGRFYDMIKAKIY